MCADEWIDKFDEEKRRGEGNKRQKHVAKEVQELADDEILPAKAGEFIFFVFTKHSQFTKHGQNSFLFF